MNIVIILSLIGVVIGVYHAYQGRYTKWVKFGWSIKYILRFVLYSLIGFILGAMVGIIVVFLCCLFVEGDYTETVEHNLISLNDGQTVEGSFYIGSGYVEGKLTYTYYRYNVDSSIVRRSISANLTKIWESDTVKRPRLVVHIVPKSNNSDWLPINGNGGSQLYDLYIPKGTIIRDVTLNNE